MNSYSRSGNFFGEPDEEVGDAELARQDQKRKILEDRMRVSTGKKRVRGSGEDGAEEEEDLWIHPRSIGSTSSSSRIVTTPSKRTVPSRTAVVQPRFLPRQSTSSSSSAPLPPPHLGLPFSTINTSLSAFSSIFSSSNCPPLPSPLSDLLSLHTALESALLFHLANEGSAVASSTSRVNEKGETEMRILNVIDLGELGRKIGSGGRRFGERELGELCWVWEGCGFGEEEDEREDDEDEELNVEKERITSFANPGEEETGGGMGFLVSRTRTRCTSSHNIITTYGLGISVRIKTNPQLPKFELLAPPGSPSRSPSRSPIRAPQSPGSIGKGREGMSVVALWSQGNEARRAEFARRLRQWGRRCAEEELVSFCSFFSTSTSVDTLALWSIRARLTNSFSQST